jgi:hypothetical protein
MNILQGNMKATPPPEEIVDPDVQRLTDLYQLNSLLSMES